VIDELMGHQRSRHGELDGGSRIGARYRHTTPEMAIRVVNAIQERLTIFHTPRPRPNWLCKQVVSADSSSTPAGAPRDQEVIVQRL
jgi:hypothetical protein